MLISKFVKENRPRTQEISLKTLRRIAKRSGTDILNSVYVNNKYVVVSPDAKRLIDCTTREKRVVLLRIVDGTDYWATPIVNKRKFTVCWSAEVSWKSNKNNDGRKVTYTPYINFDGCLMGKHPIPWKILENSFEKIEVDVPVEISREIDEIAKDLYNLGLR